MAKQYNIHIHTLCILFILKNNLTVLIFKKTIAHYYYSSEPEQIPMQNNLRMNKEPQQRRRNIWIYRIAELKLQHSIIAYLYHCWLMYCVLKCEPNRYIIVGQHQLWNSNTKYVYWRKEPQANQNELILRSFVLC